MLEIFPSSPHFPLPPQQHNNNMCRTAREEKGRGAAGMLPGDCRAKLNGITTKPFTCSMAKSLKLPNRQVKGSSQKKKAAKRRQAMTVGNCSRRRVYPVSDESRINYFMSRSYSYSLFKHYVLNGMMVNEFKLNTCGNGIVC